MNAFTIKDLENLSGIKAHTIRIWEQRYSFLRPRRTATNIRYYSNDELKTILNVALLNKYGYRISQIDRMGAAEVRERVLSLGDPEAVQERVINELVEQMVDMDLEQFEGVLDRYISGRGIEKTVLQVIFPFLEKIGLLWQTGQIHSAQEHLVSNIIRRKMIVAIEATRSSASLKKNFLLFLPEGEQHELGLLFVYYLLKSRGASVTYLGANLPLKDVEQVVRVRKPDFLFVHLTATCPNFNFEKFLSNLFSGFPTLPAVISGQLTCSYKRRIPPSVRFIKSLSEVLDFISSL